MIFGVGTDVVTVSRIAAAWQRFDRRFAERILTSKELASFAEAHDPVRFLARRFAAKEAIAKALGTGFAHGISPRLLGVTSDAWGKPQVALEPEAAAVAARLGAGDGFVSIADEAEIVTAFAVFERR
ncbi:MAG: holo-ACP synthase [Gammaproteobacteria bacterium]